MSQNSCCVPGCLVTKKEGIPLHRFPNPDVNAEKFNTWVAKIGGEIAVLDTFIVYSNRRVCNKHFEDVHRYPSRRLCPLAIPVLYLPEQLHTESVTLASLPSTSVVKNIGSDIRQRDQLFTEPVTMPALMFQETQTDLQRKKGHNKNKSCKPRGHYVPITKHSEYKSLLKQLEKSESAKVAFKKKYNLGKKMLKTTAFNIIASKMSATAKIFCQMQVSQCGKKKLSITQHYIVVFAPITDGKIKNFPDISNRFSKINLQSAFTLISYYLL